MGAGFSALELPNVASYAHKNHVLKTQEKKALSSIENETLRAQVFEAMQKPTMAEQSQALAAIDWQAANINQIDAAHAADYTRFHIERQILDGMEPGIHKANKSSRQRKLRTHGPTVVLMVKVPPRTSSLDNAPTGKPTSFFPATSIPRAPTEHYSSSIPKRARRHRSTGRSSRASQARPLRSSRQNSYKSPNSRPQRNTRSVNSDRTWRSAPKRA